MKAENALNSGFAESPMSWKAMLSLVETIAPDCRSLSSAMGTSVRLHEDTPSATMYTAYFRAKRSRAV